MKYLLDTCVLLWFLEENKKQLGPFLEWIEDPNNEVILSVVNYWEIVIKCSLGELDLPSDWFQSVENSGFVWLNLEPKHIKQLETLPSYHRDPFDRLLICQSLAEQCKLLTRDEKILRYF
jgi:PIN domain nuclease of toxin-antitoxin system